MFYHIETEARMTAGRTGTVYTLKDSGRAAEVEIWPGHGFNCLRWRVGVGTTTYDILYAAPDWESNPVPTRSGIPILFPFPNRIRSGRYSYDGKEYALPLNDSTKLNAIHGFASRRPWRVFGYGVDQESAWIHADFQPSLDAPETLEMWPSDYVLSVIFRLVENALRLEIRVRNAGASPLPFGIGFHPYLRFPCSDENIDRYRLLVPARSIWELNDNLPTGARKPVPDEFNFNTARCVAGCNLDTLYTDLGAVAERQDGVLLRGELGHADYAGVIQVWTSPDFRESVLFTPPHRHAVCIEPYTCATDGVNLLDRGVDSGWKVLAPGVAWSGVVEFRWSPDSDL